MRGCRPPGGLWALFLGKAPCPLEHAEEGDVSMRMPRGHGQRDVCCANDSADRELAAGHGLFRHAARRGHGDQGHRPKRGVGINRRRTAKRR